MAPLLFIPHHCAQNRNKFLSSLHLNAYTCSCWGAAFASLCLTRKLLDEYLIDVSQKLQEKALKNIEVVNGWYT